MAGRGYQYGCCESVLLLADESNLEHSGKNSKICLQELPCDVKVAFVYFNVFYTDDRTKFFKQ